MGVDKQRGEALGRTACVWRQDGERACWGQDGRMRGLAKQRVWVCLSGQGRPTEAQAHP